MMTPPEYWHKEETAASRRVGRALFAAVLVMACLLFGCTRRPTPSDPESALSGPLTNADLPRPAADAGPDSTGAPGPQNVQKPAESARSQPSGLLGFFSKVVGTTGRTSFKKATINIVQGNQTNTGKKATVAVGDNASAKHGDTKAKGGAVLSQDGGTATGLTGSGNLAQGDGNSQVKQDTTEEAAGFGGAVGKPVGIAAGLILGGLAAWLFIGWLRRRNASQA